MKFLAEKASIVLIKLEGNEVGMLLTLVNEAAQYANQCDRHADVVKYQLLEQKIRKQIDGPVKGDERWLADQVAGQLSDRRNVAVVAYRLLYGLVVPQENNRKKLEEMAISFIDHNPMLS